MQNINKIQNERLIILVDDLDAIVILKLHCHALSYDKISSS